MRYLNFKHCTFKKISFFLYVAALGLSCIVQDFSLQPTDSLVLASGLPSYGTQAYLLHGMWDLSSLTRDWTHIPCIAKWILKPWTTRKVLKHAKRLKKKKLFKKPFKKTINSLVTDEEWLEVPRMSLLTYRVLPIVFAAKYF